jgi:hypothetical protein
VPALVVVIDLAMLGGRCFVEDLTPAIGTGHVVEGVEGWIETSRKALISWARRWRSVSLCLWGKGGRISRAFAWPREGRQGEEVIEFGLGLSFVDANEGDGTRQ